MLITDARQDDILLDVVEYGEHKHLLALLRARNDKMASTAIDVAANHDMTPTPEQIAKAFIEYVNRELPAFEDDRIQELNRQFLQERTVVYQAATLRWLKEQSDVYELWTDSMRYEEGEHDPDILDYIPYVEARGSFSHTNPPEKFTEAANRYRTTLMTRPEKITFEY